MSAAEVQSDGSEFDVFSHQIKCDINFLEARLKIMHAQHKPNEQVIRTYEDMLRNRLQVLQRLKDEHKNQSQNR
jgi:hypothetical protein